MDYEYRLTCDRQKLMAKYILKKDIPGCKKGTVFVHDVKDDIVGSSAEGCLKLAYTDNGQCQQSAPYGGGTIVFHASVRKDKEWFDEIPISEEALTEAVYKAVKNDEIKKQILKLIEELI